MINKIAFVLEEMTVSSPGQQLLDRFLIGYNNDGEFHTAPKREITLAVRQQTNRAIIEARVKDFGLALAASAQAAVMNAEAIVVDSSLATAELFKAMPEGARCFVYGGLIPEQSSQILEIASDRRIALTSATGTATAFRLPPLETPLRSAVEKALILVQGEFPGAELEGLEGLFSFAEYGPLVRTQLLIGERLWTSAYSAEWSPLLLGAFSRSNNIQGDPEKDGRTQDLFGLHLAEHLSKNARAWILDHSNGVRTAIFVLNGALADFNIAMRLRSGRVISTQLYRPPPPMQDHFSQLAAILDKFFENGKSPWQSDKSLRIAAILQQLKYPG
jgi:hypothetical protein